MLIRYLHFLLQSAEAAAAPPAPRTAGAPLAPRTVDAADTALDAPALTLSEDDDDLQVITPAIEAQKATRKKVTRRDLSTKPSLDKVNIQNNSIFTFIMCYIIS